MIKIGDLDRRIVDHVERDPRRVQQTTLPLPPVVDTAEPQIGLLGPVRVGVRIAEQPVAEMLHRKVDRHDGLRGRRRMQHRDIGVVVAPAHDRTDP
jgi:hypothetical protein